jgi:aerobic-type carbon monoxide dehydrogenase small subunit (CoxS/CutS family)
MEPAAVLEFACNGRPVSCPLDEGETLLSVLRERLGLHGVKDGCAPQGQCGCCTVLVDGAPRVSCVTPATRVAGRAVTTIEGLEPATRDGLAGVFATAGASQCGFCTPGIILRCAALLGRGARPLAKAAIDRALAAHLCRCTGWQTIYEALARPEPAGAADLDARAARATLEGATPQRCGARVALGRAGFADDLAPAGALVAVPAVGDALAAVEAAGIRFAVAPTMHEARLAAGKVHGRRTTARVAPPIPAKPCPPGGVALATGWVEPAYLEPDASWCEPGGEPATPLANGGAFGGKVTSRAPVAARELAAQFGRPVRVVYSREDVVRLGPKRPPISATARLTGEVVEIDADAVAPIEIGRADHYGLRIDARQRVAAVAGPPSAALRAPWAESAILVEGALAAAGIDRAARLSGAAADVLLDTCVASPDGAYAGARVVLAGDGRLRSVEVRVAAGEPVAPDVLRSYCIGAVHMALGWVLTEGIAVDPATGDVLDRTIRSFGIIRAKDVPPVTVTIVDDRRPPRAGSGAVYAAVAAATWIAVGFPPSWPARDTPTARLLRR